MKVYGTGGIDPIRAYNNQVKRKKAETRRDAAPQADSLEISREAREIQFYKNALARLPDVREELVESLKQRIESGTYRPDAEKIAAGILEERLLDKRV